MARLSYLLIALWAALHLDVPLAFAQEFSASASATAAPCRELLNQAPTLKPEECDTLRLAASSAKSVRGRPILYRDVPARRQPASLRVLVLGTIHGDELTAATLAFRWIKLAQEGQGSKAHEITWRFIPVVNPDGFLARPATRVNARGVDLNRNFPTPAWEREAHRYWVTRTSRDPRRFPGHTALSEPESRFIDQQIDQFAPDLIVSIHAPLGVLDFDGPAIPPQRLGRLYLDPLGIFPGSLGHYGAVNRGIPVVTIELPHALRAPQPDEIQTMWNDLIRWIEQRLLKARGVAPPPIADEITAARPTLSSADDLLRLLLPHAKQPVFHLRDTR
ncbi:MAG: M14 family zinc carboxypeptidase [Casimicrobiaceae bacterium]|nr:M14 family zinc carboxypeptidase [Casimicrobiaceae bacterium]MDW8311685.1 M14 family zinc carboxypeptidase [Burkholderiales bacterium]